MITLYLILTTLALALVYVFGGRLQFERFPHRRRLLSLGAGLSVAYVFIQLFPELREAHEQFLEATAHRNLLFPEHRVAFAALVGFVLYYGLEHLVAWSRGSVEGEEPGGHAEPVYWLHIGGFAAYSALVSYLPFHMPEAGLKVLGLYFAPMFVHLLGVDHSLRREHGALYDSKGKWVLAAAVLAGAALGSLFEIPIPILSTLRGLISGGVVINSMIMELPKENEGRFGAFCLGAIGYAVLLIVLT